MAKKKKKITLPNSLIVTQANELIEARYNLPVGEQRLILTMIARIQPDDEDFKMYQISVKEFAEFLGLKGQSAYMECKKITAKLLTRVIFIQEEGRLLQIGWMSSAEYIDGTGLINLSFDPLLKPYLLKLKSSFTSCKLDMILSFKSQYTMRVYTLLKQYERIGEREFEVTILREMLGIRKELHVEYSDFKRNVLEYTKNELVKKADLRFEYDEIKASRKVVKIRFRIFNNEIASLPVASESVVEVSDVSASDTSEVDELLLLVPEPYRAKKTLLKTLTTFFAKHDFDYVKRNIIYCNKKASSSYLGFLTNALTHDWGQDDLDHASVSKADKKVISLWERQGFASQKEYDEFMYKQQMEKYGLKL